MKNHNCFIHIGGRTYYSWDSKNTSDWCATSYKVGMEPTATHTGDWIRKGIDNEMVNIQLIAGVEVEEAAPLTWAEAKAILDDQRKVGERYTVRMGYTVRGLERKRLKEIGESRDFDTWRYSLVPVEGTIVDKQSGIMKTLYKIEQADGTFAWIDRDEVLEIVSKEFNVTLDNAKTPKVYVAKFNGQTFNRSSARAYTHAVILEAHLTGKLTAKNFCGRLDLAVKAAAQYDSRNYTAHIVKVTVKQK